MPCDYSDINNHNFFNDNMAGRLIEVPSWPAVKRKCVSERVRVWMCVHVFVCVCRISLGHCDCAVPHLKTICS